MIVQLFKEENVCLERKKIHWKGYDGCFSAQDDFSMPNSLIVNEYNNE